MLTVRSIRRSTNACYDSSPSGGFLTASSSMRRTSKPFRRLFVPCVSSASQPLVLWTWMCSKTAAQCGLPCLAAAHVPPLSHQSLAHLRSAVKQAMDKTGRDMKRNGGVAILDASDQEAARNLFTQLSEYGIFVVPGGELESWLKSLGATGHGPSWLIDVFERMGEDPDAPGYLKPSSDDVWKFLSQVKAWLVDPTRKGIPA